MIIDWYQVEFRSFLYVNGGDSVTPQPQFSAIFPNRQAAVDYAERQVKAWSETRFGVLDYYVNRITIPLAGLEIDV